MTVVFLAIDALSVGCHQLRGLPDRHARELPDIKEVVGTWTIDEPSLKRLRTSHYGFTRVAPEDHLVVLRQDGTCLFKSYSDFQSDAHYISSEGHWKLKMEDTVGGSGMLRAAVAIELQPESSVYAFAQFWIVRERNGLVLWDYIGDPDYVQYADFHKSGE